MLKIFCDIYDGEESLGISSVIQIYNQFWTLHVDSSRRALPNEILIVKNQLIRKFANLLLERQTRVLPKEYVCDQLCTDESSRIAFLDFSQENEDILLMGDEISFFHQSFFEHVLARDLIARNTSGIIQYLRSSNEFSRKYIILHLLNLAKNRNLESIVITSLDQLISSTNLLRQIYPVIQKHDGKTHLSHIPYSGYNLHGAHRYIRTGLGCCESLQAT